MPIYEYECQKCGLHAEVLQKFSDPPVSKCDKCKGKMRKLISQSTFHLKGTGWYVTDYASKDNASKDYASKDNVSRNSDSSTSKTEKTEKKAEKAEAKSSGTDSKAKESSSKSTSKTSSKD